MNKLKNFQNILLVQLGDIGDVVLTTPTIRAVKETYPEASVSIMVRKPYGCILLADRNLHEVFEFAKSHGPALKVLNANIRFVSRLRRAHFDLVIDLRTGDRGAIFAFLTGAPERVGRYGNDRRFWHNLLFTKLVPVFPQSGHPGADQSLRIVRGLGIDTKDSIPRLYVVPADRTRVMEMLSEFRPLTGDCWITINPCSRWKYKEWGYEKWGEVIDRIWQTHRLRTILVGAPEDTAAAELILKGRSDFTYNLTGKTTLGELAALVSMSTLHLGVDSAAPHIATAVGTPTVTIHGPSDWRAWRVTDEFHRIVTPVMDCLPCHKKGCHDTGESLCLKELVAEATIRVVDEILVKASKDIIRQ